MSNYIYPKNPGPEERVRLEAERKRLQGRLAANNRELKTVSHDHALKLVEIQDKLGVRLCLLDASLRENTAS